MTSTNAHNPARDLLPWIGALCALGLAIGVAGSLLGRLPWEGLPASAGFGLLFGLGIGLRLQQRTLLGPDGYRARTRQEIVVLWWLIVGTLAVVTALFTLSWKLTS